LFLSVHAIYPQGLGNVSGGSGSDIGFKKAGLRMGLTIPSANYDPAFGVGVTADLGKINEMIGLGVEVDYWSSQKGEGYKEQTKTCFGGGVTAYLYPKLDFPFTSYIGAGLGVYRYSLTHTESLKKNDLEETKVFEPHFEIGGRYPYMENLEFTGAFRINVSDVSTYSILVGALFNFEN